MNPFQIISTTAKFEIANSITFRRLVVAAILSLFPPAMLFLVLLVSQGSVPGINIVICIFVFIVGLLSLLLWATPNVYSEMESRGWVYLTARSYGRIGILFGKYVAAVVNAWAVCVVSMTFCLLIGESLATFEQPVLRLWVGYIGIITLAAVSYGAIYSLIGVVFQRRSMVIAAVYTFVSELAIANIPALISNLTVRAHLQGLAIKWLPIEVLSNEIDDDVPEFLTYASTNSSILQVLAILMISTFALAMAAYVIRYREYVTSDET